MIREMRVDEIVMEKMEIGTLEQEISAI